MSTKLSRRCWLLATAATTASLSPIASVPLCADSPDARPQLRISRAPSVPVQSRSIPLKGLAEEPVVVTAIAADPRGEFVAVAGDDHAIRILRTSNLTTIRTLSGHRDVIRTLAFDRSGGKLVSAGNDGQLVVWDRDESFGVLQRMKGTPALARVRFSPDGSEMAAVGFDNEVFLIGRREREQPAFECECNDLRAVAYREDNEMIAVAGRSGDLHLFDRSSGRLISDHSLHRGRIHDLVFHRQSNTAVCVGEDGSVTVFDTDTRRLVHRVSVTSGKLFAVAVINSQLVAVAGSDNVIRIVNTDEGTVVCALEGHRGSVSALSASNDLLFSGSFDATLRRWTIHEIGPSQERIAESGPNVDR